jgi:hypothetical protein
MNTLPSSAGGLPGPEQATAEEAAASGAYVQELARWVSPPDSTRADGVPDTAYPARLSPSGGEPAGAGHE